MKPILKDLYLIDNNTLGNVQHTMLLQYGFHGTYVFTKLAINFSESMVSDQQGSHSRRSYVHRFSKWGFRKHNGGAKVIVSMARGS